jgi:Protein of unknown function (DUF2924)
MSATESAPGPALGDGEPTAAPSTPAVLMQRRLARLQELDGSALREEWRKLCRSDAPRLSRDLLMRALAYRLQEIEFGGLPKWAQQSLKGSATAIDPAAADGVSKPNPMQPLLKPGARIVREWHGRTHSVIVLNDAFEFEGRQYPSLTQIAREITGAHWSGPRFFGLAKRSSEPATWASPARDEDSNEMIDEAIGLGSPGQGGATIEPRPRATAADGARARRAGLRQRESAHG